MNHRTEEKKEHLFEYLSDLYISESVYKGRYNAPGEMLVLEAVIDELERHSSCPSIVNDNSDPESRDILPAIKRDLRRITLKNHSLMVAHILLRNIDSMRDILSYAIIALAHDLGKIPVYRKSGIFNSREHQLVSAMKFDEIEESTHDGERKYIIPFPVSEAIRGHHYRGIGIMSDRLRAADMEARKWELLHLRPGFREAPVREWFNIHELAERIAPHVNHLRGGCWKAFSFKNLVYCRPDLIYKKAQQLCLDAKVIDIRFIYESEKDLALKEIVDILRENDLIAAISGKHIAAKFDIRGPFGVKTSVLTPIKGSIFNMNEIERRKVGYLEAVQYVHFHKGRF